MRAGLQPDRRGRARLAIGRFARLGVRGTLIFRAMPTISAESGPAFVSKRSRFRLMAVTNWELVRPYGRWLYYTLFPSRRPEYFRAAWKSPSYDLGQDLAPLWNDRTGDLQTFIFFPLVDWHTRMQRSQHLAMALADLGHRCIYLNPHLGLEFPKPPLFSPRAQLSPLCPGVFELHIHLPAEHPLDSRSLQRREVNFILTEVDKALSNLGVTDAIQVVSIPSWLDVVTVLRNRHGFPILYDCHDYLPGFDRLARDIIEAEPRLLKICDHVMFSAQHLMNVNLDRVSGLESKAALLRNANRPDDFVPYDKPRVPNVRRRVGYVGSLDHWFDVDLLRQTAALQPDLDFVLAGRIEDNRIRELERAPNIQFAGEIPHDAVPPFLHGCDAGMIPFCRVPLTMATNPIKLYEYLSAGLPVVSTRLPEVEFYHELVYIADTPAEFASFLGSAVNEEDTQMRDKRTATGHAESWLNRAKVLVKRVTSLDRLNRGTTRTTCLDSPRSSQNEGPAKTMSSTIVEVQSP